MRQPLEAMDRVLPIGGDLSGALKQPLFAVGFQRRQTGRRGDGVARIGITVEQLDHMLGAVHEGVMDLLGGQHRPHRDHAIGQPLGAGDHVGHDVEIIGGKRRAQTAKASDDLIENQQDAMLARQFAQALQIALWRDQHAGRPRHGFDDHGGDRFGAMQRHDPFQLIGQIGPMLGLTPAKGVLGKLMRMGQMIDAVQKRAEELAVIDDAAHGNPAEIHPVIAALAPDQAGARALADSALIGDGDFQRGLDRFRSGIGEKHMLHRARRHIAQAVGQLESLGMAHLEGRRIVQLTCLLADRLDNLGAVMARITAPQPRHPVQHLTPIGGAVMHPVGRYQHPRCLFELAVRGEGHPERGKVIRNGVGTVKRHSGIPYFAGPVARRRTACWFLTKWSIGR